MKYIVAKSLISLNVILILFFIKIYIIHEFNNKISVIIPTFNREKLIVRCINSVLNQTYNNFEILIIDDGSNDNTKDKIELLNDNRIRYIKLRKNKGANFGRNIGVMRARGKYISFLDSDDLFYPSKLQKQLNNMKEKNSDLDFCKIKVFNNTIFEKIIPAPLQEKNFRDTGYLEELCNENFISTQAIIIKKKVAEKFPFDVNMPRLQDYDFILRIANNITISYTEEVLVDVQIQNDSITNNRTKLQEALEFLRIKEYNLNKRQKIKLLNFIYTYKSKNYNTTKLNYTF